jgi:gliding motility-associated-like protein
MKKLLFLIVLFCGLGITKQAKATHAAGGELTYEWISGTTYRFTFKFYRDCTGGPLACDSFGMCYENTCNTTYYKKFLNRVAFLPNGDTNGAPVPTGCPNPTTCADPFSIIPGFQEWWYQGDVTLNAQCTEWAFWVVEVARNTAISNVAGSSSFNLHIQTTLNNLVAQGNSSPNFSFKPIPYICLNQPWIYNNGAFDANGDSLSYESITPYTSPGNGSACFLNITNSDCIGNYPPAVVAAAPGFPAYNAATNAIPCVGGVYGINPNTGLLTTIPSTVGQFVITVEVTEWRNGVKIGKIIRDIQVSVVPCVVPLPIATLPTATNLTFNLATLFYNTCLKDTISFCVLVSGPIDTSQIIVQYNMPVILPGSTTFVTGAGTDSVLICTQWVPSSFTDTGLHVITIQYQDTNCLYNPIGVINSFSLPIYVIPQTQAFSDTTICAGESAQLYAVGGSSFNWVALPGGSGNGSLSCTNCSNPIVSPTTTTSYVVTSNLTSQCADNVDTVTVTVASVPIVNAGVDTTLCPNSIYQMMATVTPAGGNYTYQWTPATALNLPNTLNPICINPVVTTNYTLTVTPNGAAACAVSDVMRITVLQGFDIINKDTTICKGSFVFITTVGSNGYNYNWTPNYNINNPTIKNPILSPDSLTTYTLTASYPGCPDSIQAITIGVEVVPTVNAGADRLICLYDTVRLQGLVSPDVADPFYTYTWSAAADLTSTTILNPYFTGLLNSVYTLTVKTPKGCQGSDNIAIQVIPNGFLDGLPYKELCPGDTASFTANGALTYLWQPGVDVSDSVNKTIKTAPVATTIFTLYGTDVHGCVDTQHVTVFVASNALLSLGADVTIYPGDSAYIIAGGNCNSWLWSPATGLSATDQMDVYAKPIATTQYIVNGKTEFNCLTTDTIIVNVNPISLINTPNAFSPGNGSGLNDEFKADRNGIVTLNYFRIFNRWGQMVFETNDINKGWNGQYLGKPQPIGTYVFQIDAINNLGTHFTKGGNLTLIR